MDDQALRTQLVNMLTVRQAHADFADAVADFPEEHINTIPPHTPYSFWHVVEHMRICQKDILDYIESDSYVWPTFPDDLWPDAAAQTDVVGWQASIDTFLSDRQHFVDIIKNPESDLFAQLANSGKHQHNILREVGIIASHNAYHTGGLIMMRQTLGIW